MSDISRAICYHNVVINVTLYVIIYVFIMLSFMSSFISSYVILMHGYTRCRYYDDNEMTMKINVIIYKLSNLYIITCTTRCIYIDNKVET